MFGDFCGILRTGAPGSLAELTESRRFPEGGEICIMKDAINGGQAEKAWDYMNQPGRDAVVSRVLPPKNALRQFLSDSVMGAWISERTPARHYYDADSVDEAWERFERFRILTPFEVGPYGAAALNKLLRSILDFPDTGAPVPGETFLILKNDYATNVFNGDTGDPLVRRRRRAAARAFGGGGFAHETASGLLPRSGVRKQMARDPAGVPAAARTRLCVHHPQIPGQRLRYYSDAAPAVPRRPRFPDPRDCLHRADPREDEGRDRRRPGFVPPCGRSPHRPGFKSAEALRTAPADLTINRPSRTTPIPAPFLQPHA